MVEKGPVNSAIVDLIEGEVYQVENSNLERFETSHQNDTDEFIESLKKEKLIIKKNLNAWIPRPVHEPLSFQMRKKIEDNYFELEIEEGTDLDLIGQRFDASIISKISYYGTKKIDDIFHSTPIEYKVKNIDSCYSRSRVSRIFKKISEENYYLNNSQNNCWGKKLAITTDCKIRPCIHSTIVIRDLKTVTSSNEIFDEAWKYWTINKDQVKKCMDCEFKYVCFDCREIAYREHGNIFDTNPLCSYNPYEGV